MSGAEVAPLLRRERMALADVLDRLTDEQWETPSLCGEWLVRDVVAHLVWLAELSTRRMLRDVVRYSPATINGAVAKVARDGDRLPTADLPGRLRAAADGTFRAPGFPLSAALAEVVIHGEDVMRPLGIDRSVGGDALLPCLDLYASLGPVVARSRRARKVRMVATDIDWSHGKGPERMEPALDLLLFMAGR